MTAQDTASAPTLTMTPAEQKKRKRKALLAAGLVLGVGGIITLATWTGNQFAGTEIESRGFQVTDDVEISADQDAWVSDTTEAELLSIDFSIDPEGLLPGGETAAPVYVRLMEGTRDATNIELSNLAYSVTHNGEDFDYSNYTDADQFSYEIIQTASCSASATGEVFASGETLDDIAQGTRIPLAPGETALDPGETVPLCVKLQAAEDGVFAPESTTGIVWTVTDVDPNGGAASSDASN